MSLWKKTPMNFSLFQSSVSTQPSKAQWTNDIKTKNAHLGKIDSFGELKSGAAPSLTN